MAGRRRRRSRPGPIATSDANGNAYGLTTLSPIRDGWTPDGTSYADAIRDLLQGWNAELNSPMANVPNTCLCRLFVLDDVVHQSLPSGSALDTLCDLSPLIPDWVRRAVLPTEDHLKSAYLVFCCNLYGGPSGDVDTYLRGMWAAIGARIAEVWGRCYDFEHVADADSFARYMRRCEVPASLYFVGSNDQPLAEQLKALYLKQEFSRFAVDHQGLAPSALRAALDAFLQRVAPDHVPAPTWAPGRYSLAEPS